MSDRKKEDTLKTFTQSMVLGTFFIGGLMLAIKMLFLKEK